MKNVTSAEEILVLPSEEELPGGVTTTQNFLGRIFAPIRRNSLRLVIINTVVCIMSSSFFVFPIAFRTYGIIFGAVIILFSNLFNYFTCKFIYEASEHAKTNNYLGIIAVMLGDRFAKVAKVTFLVDYFSNYVNSVLLAWNITQYLLVCNGFISHDALIDSETLEVNPYHRQVFNIRFVFVILVFVTFTHVIEGSNQNAMKTIMVTYLVVFFAFVGYVTYDLRDFYDYYSKKNQHQISFLKEPSMQTLKYLFIIITAFYIQPSLMTMKTEILNPNLRRMVKSAFVSYIFLTLVSCACGFYCYFSLGDLFTTDVFMLRKAFKGKEREGIYMAILAMITIMSLFYTKFFHANMRSFLKASYLGDGASQVKYLIPWVLALLTALVYPKIINFMGFCAVSVLILNGYGIPVLLKKKLYKIDGKSKLKMWLCDLSLVCMTLLGLGSFTALILSD